MWVAQAIVLFTVCVVYASGLYVLGKGYQFLLDEVSSLTASSTSEEVKTNWIVQPLDHFDGRENRTWKMRFLERQDLWQPDGPIYLYIGGEGKAYPGFLKSNRILYDIANETNGAMFLSEHRYYGESMPLDNKETDNLRFLSSRQALADIANLLQTIKAEPKFLNSKVVVVGGSYAGNLAAWAKLLYPDLIDAAISSSGPVLAKRDFYEYLEKVTDNYEQYGTEDCIENIRKKFKRYENLLKSKEGIDQLKEEENVCESDDLNNLENQQLFIMNNIEEYMFRSQYGTPEAIKSHCEKLNTRLLVSFPKLLEEHWRASENCYTYDFDGLIKYMQNSSVWMSWAYQTCTEFGYFQTTTSEKQLFLKYIPVELYDKICIAMYGPEFNKTTIEKGVFETNQLYGGLKPNVTNVVFVNGDMDPWSRLSVLEDISYDAPAKVIARSSHCRDITGYRKSDPEELIEARKYIKYLIKKWIKAEEYKGIYNVSLRRKKIFY